MTLAEILTAVAVVLSLINAVVLVATYRRAGLWRESDEARDLMARMSACEGDVAGIKVRMENVATKADIARATGEIEAVERLLKGTDAAVVRIEQLLMSARTRS